MSEQVIKPDVEIVCTCGGKVFAEAASMAVLHSLPTCKRCDEMEALAFLTWLRKTLQNPLAANGEN